MPCLGTELDSVAFEARLPLVKLFKAKNLVLKWLSKRPGKKRKLLPLIGGYLQPCCKVIVPARLFLRCLIDISITPNLLLQFRSRFDLTLMTTVCFELPSEWHFSVFLDLENLRSHEIYL